MNCYYCKKECKNDNSLRNHERLCRENPDRQQANIDKALAAATKKTESCDHCSKKFSKANITRHMDSCKKNPKNIKICPVCKNEHAKTGTTCSYSCSNKFFRHGRKGGTQYKDDDDLIEAGNYRALCFRHHGKKCIVCKEEKIVTVHHINENHDDNRIENLVPLCPTHHQYIHSRYKDEVQPFIDEFLLSVV